MTTVRIYKSVTFFVIIVFTFVALAITIFTFHQYFAQREAQQTSVAKSNIQTLDKAIKLLNEELGKIIKKTVQIADQAGGVLPDSASYEQLQQDIKQLLRENAPINSISIAYAPYIFYKNKRLYSIKFSQGTDIPTHIESLYDYSIADWYIAAETAQAQWINPQFDKRLHKTISRYAIPLFRYNQETHQKDWIGACSVDIHSDYLNKLIASVLTDKQSYTMLVTENGLILAHPLDRYVTEGKTLFDFAQLPGNKDFIQLGNAIMRSVEGEIAMDIYTNSGIKKYRAIFNQVPFTTWKVIVIGSDRAALIPTIEIRRALIAIVLALIFLFSFIFALIFYMHQNILRAVWLTSSVCATLCAIGISTIWAFDIISVENHVAHDNIMDSDVGLNRFFDMQKKTNPFLYNGDVHFIPTGLFVYAVNLESTNPNMAINGHIWQKYDLTKDADLDRSLAIFNATEQSFDKIYDITEGSVQTVGWRFSAKIKGNFNYTKYPFDEQNLELILEHKDYAKKVILTPDFSAFTALNNPHPEIDVSTNTVPWDINNTYFFYSLTNYDTNFGINAYPHQRDFPDLCFNIAVRRKFVYPFTASILPIIIIVIVAFSILLVTGLSSPGSEMTSLVLSLNSGLFFATAVSHQTFQRAVEATKLTYFEYFYFLLYVIILLVTINGLCYCLNQGGTFIMYNNNIIPRVLFWPLAMISFLATTLLFFY